jgi:transposase
MEVLYPRCAGLDVHAGSVTACVRIAAGAEVTYQHRTVATTTRGLLDLDAWLTGHGCTHVAMEATGVYWKPVWHVLEAHVTLVLANAMHIRNVPGRKSDMNDATWIADLLAHGLIRSSFVPPAPIQALRDLTRTRKQLVGEIARHTLRIQKTLEDANLKLTQVISDILGTSGRAILRALIAGETDPQRLADLTRGRLKASRTDLVDALHGRVTEHHRFLIQLHLTQIDALDAAVAAIEARIGDALGPFRAAVSLLTTMPGLSDTTARRQASLHTHPPECTVAEDHPDHGGLGGHAQKGRVPPGPIPSHQESPRGEESHPRRREFDADRRLLHAARWC